MKCVPVKRFILLIFFYYYFRTNVHMVGNIIGTKKEIVAQKKL